MSATDVLTHAATALGGAGGLLAYLRARASRDAAAHQARAAEATEATGRHQVVGRAIEVSAEAQRAWERRLTLVETALRASEDARIAERESCAVQITALKSENAQLKRELAETQSLVRALRTELDELRRDSLAQVSPRRPSDRPEE